MAKHKRRVAGGSLYRPKYRDRNTGEVRESPVWHMKYYVKGSSNPIRASTGEQDWNLAAVILKAKMSKAAANPKAAMHQNEATVADVLALVVSDYTANKRKSLDDVKSKINLHLLPVFGSIRVLELESDHIWAYIRSRQKEGAENASINRELAPLRRGLNLGHEARPRLVPELFKFPTLTENNVREGILEAESYRALRDALPDYLRLPFVIAYHTGIRKGELLSILVKNVEFSKRRIFRPGRTTKNGRKRYIPIYGEMVPYIEIALDEIKTKYPECPFLAQRDGAPLGSFRKAWATACRLAGVEGLLFHDLRRTALTNMEEGGIPRSQAMEVSGHLSESAYRRYLIQKSDGLARTAATMEEFLKPHTGQSVGQSNRINKPVN